MLSRAVTKKRRGRRLFTALAVTSIVAGTFLAAGTALAVHEFQFQLDGDTTNTAFSPPHPPATTPGIDWDGIFNVAQANGVETVSNNATNVGSGKTFDAANFVRDFESGSGLHAELDVDDVLYRRRHDLRDGQQGHPRRRQRRVAVQPRQQRQQQDRHHERLRRSVHQPGERAQDLLLRGGEERQQRHQRRRRLVPAGRRELHVAERFRQLHRGAPGRRHAGRSRANVRRRREHRQGVPLGGECEFPCGRQRLHRLERQPEPRDVVNGTKGCNNLPIATGADCKTTGAGDSLCATTNAFCPPPRRGTEVPPCTLPWNTTSPPSG